MSLDGEVQVREGRPSDLRATFDLGERAWDAWLAARGLAGRNGARSDAELGAKWDRERPLIEFVAAQPGRYWIAEDGDGLAGYARVTRFGSMDELVDMWVYPSHAWQLVARDLLKRCWPESPSRELGRVALAPGTPQDLSLYTDFGVMPATGHWHLQHRLPDYLERRSQEAVDSTEPGVHVLKADRAVEEWVRLEPPAIGHERPHLHEFFGRTRSCLAAMDAGDGHASGLCWVSPGGEIGPAVGRTAEDLVPVVLAALDRVAKSQEPETLAVYCTTGSWWLLDRLRRLGFRVRWPSWVMSSVPLPGLDRYLPTRPARVL